MNVKQTTEPGVYQLEVTETERRVMIDALTNHQLHCSRNAVEPRDELPAGIRGLGTPSADAAGGLLRAFEVCQRLSKSLKAADR